MSTASFALSLTLDGRRRTEQVDPRMTLVEALRECFDATGPKVGCRTGDCGACTVELGTRAVKSCLELAVACEDAEVTTIEGLAGGDDLTPIQQALWDEHGVQCGFCVSGMVFAARELLRRVPDPDEAQIRHAIGGNLCRCTGYEKIVVAVKTAAAAGEG
jgi:carbon-monoxide dehydrogenase small subunit